MNRPTFTVTEINHYLKDRIESDLFLENLCITGEISNLKFYASGKQYYFSLIDPEAHLSCVIYASFLGNIKFPLQNGLKVIVFGKMKFFQKKGTLSFQVAYVALQGIGQNTLAFEALKKQLEQEGFFESSRKKSIPPWIRSVGLITGLHSAAMWDFIHILHRSAPHVCITVIPATMQGIDCSGSVIQAVLKAQERPFDVLIITRGGGSKEDLSGFNQELLIRTLVQSKLPIISALGHEIDNTLTDLIADKRCSTPSDAAQFIAKPWETLRDRMTQKLLKAQEKLSFVLERHQVHLMSLLDRASFVLEKKLSQNQQSMLGLFNRLKPADPLHKLRQGYSITKLEIGESLVKQASQVKPGDMLITRVFEGEIKSRVIECTHD